MRMVVLPFHGIIPNSASRLCWGKRKGRGWRLPAQPDSGLCQGAAAAAGAEPSLPQPDSHSPDTARADRAGQSHCWKGPAKGRAPAWTNHCWYCFTINRRAENRFSQSLVCYLLKTLLLSSLTVSTVTSPRTHGPQLLRRHPKRSAHLHL